MEADQQHEGDRISRFRVQCRIWWPQHLSLDREQQDKSCKMLLLGWAINGFGNSIDIVVATSLPFQHGGSHPTNTHLQVAIDAAQIRMPLNLQDCASLSVVGHYVFNHGCKISQSYTNRTDISGPNIKNKGTNNDPCMSCNGYDANDLQNNESCLHERFLQFRVSDGGWIELSYQSVSLADKEIRWVPKLWHLHWKGTICVPDIHTVIYEQPRYDSHHFSYKSWSSLCKPSENYNAGKPSIRPSWMVELEQKQEPSNLDVVMLAINSACAVHNISQETWNLHTSCKQLSLISIIMCFSEKITAASVALIAVVFYIGVQLISRIMCDRAFLFVNKTLCKLFRNTWTNLDIRGRQLLCWPAILFRGGCGFQPNVAVGHTTALLKHSTWSAIAVDMFLGNLAGITLLIHCEATSDWVLHFVADITDNILRSGCVWLMGVPAGFKLNTELAETLGMISLNVIQVWSTLWLFVKPLLNHSIRLLAVCGIFLGFTIQAALLIDVILLATFHLSTLHWFLALVYSYQIQALSALSRLFRGRKRNPLRARIDSFDYSVEQHVVGSLVFTPLLLLVPTTSVFYVFFTILNTIASLACISCQFLILLLHTFPYSEIAIWLVCPKRFPSGIWFKQIWTGSSQQSVAMLRCSAVRERNTDFILRSMTSHGTVKELDSQSSNVVSPHGNVSSGFFSHDSEIVVSILGSNSARLGEIIYPHLTKAFKGLSLSAGVSCAYKVFSGGRIPSSLDIGMPVFMPWISISFKEFWWLTYEAVLTCL